jgi:hypothetical protein
MSAIADERAEHPFSGRLLSRADQTIDASLIVRWRRLLENIDDIEAVLTLITYQNNGYAILSSEQLLRGRCRFAYTGFNYARAPVSRQISSPTSSATSNDERSGPIATPTGRP